MYYAYITKIESVRPHPNADKIQLATVFDNQIVVDLETKVGDVVVYFPTDGQLSDEFATANNLKRSQGGFFEDNTLRVRTQKFRKEVSDGFVCPLSFLAKLVPEQVVASLKVGDRFSILDGKQICKKYVSSATVRSRQSNKVKGRRGETQWFPKHFDTENIQYYLHKLKPGDMCVVTLKMHGTSHRVGRVLDEVKLSWWKKLLFWWAESSVDNPRRFAFMSGTRNVILDETNQKSGYYSRSFRDDVSETFRSRLNKGEVVFFEIVGYEAPGKPIVPRVNTKSLGHKQFTNHYGEVMTYDYGCKDGAWDIYVYRIAYVNEDGYLFDLSWDAVKYRAAQLGVKAVPELEKFIYDGDSDRLITRLKTLGIGDGPDPIGAHWREGAVLRVENSAKLGLYKFKNQTFKLLESGAKAEDVVDTEEAS